MWIKAVAAFLIFTLGGLASWKVTDLWWRDEVTQINKNHEKEISNVRSEEQSKCAAAQRATAEAGTALQAKFDDLRRNYSAVLKRVRDNARNSPSDGSGAAGTSRQPPQGTQPAGLPRASRAEDIDEEELGDAYASAENLSQLEGCLAWVRLIRSQYGLK